MNEKNSIKGDLLFLLMKMGILAALLTAAFLFIFGISRCSDNSMNPAFKDGDLAFYYRLQKEYNISDVVVVEKDDEKQIRRIIAKAGDKVEITEEGLKINGYLQRETGIYEETLPYVEGIVFPLEVPENEYFVLGDSRSNAKDSRIYGTVKKEEMKGGVMTLIRRRGL